MLLMSLFHFFFAMRCFRHLALLPMLLFSMLFTLFRHFRFHCFFISPDYATSLSLRFRHDMLTLR